MAKSKAKLAQFELHLNRFTAQAAGATAPVVAPTRRPRWVPRRNPWAPVEPGRYAQGMLIVDPDEPTRVVL